MIPSMRAAFNGAPVVAQVDSAVFVDITRVRAGDDCYAGFTINSDGTLDGISSLGTKIYNVDLGTWLAFGSSSDVWVERTITGGSPGTLNDDDAGTGRLQLSTSRAFSIVETTQTETHTVIITFDFYDASTGGNLITSKSVTFSAEKETP